MCPRKGHFPGAEGGGAGESTAPRWADWMGGAQAAWCREHPAEGCWPEPPWARMEWALPVPGSLGRGHSLSSRQVAALQGLLSLSGWQGQYPK